MLRMSAQEEHGHRQGARAKQLCMAALDGEDKEARAALSPGGKVSVDSTPGPGEELSMARLALVRR